MFSNYVTLEGNYLLSLFSLSNTFFSAKILIKGEPNVSYICSRYYRAPELIFGSTTYTASIGTLLYFDLELIL